MTDICIDASALGGTGNMPTVDTVKADGFRVIAEVFSRDCQSEQGSIQFLRVYGPELDERYHFGEQSFSTS